MANIQPAATGAAPLPPNIPAIFTPPRERPKPLSNFPHAHMSAYVQYLFLWSKRYARFYTLLKNMGSDYQTTLPADVDGADNQLMELWAGRVSDAREALNVDIGILELRFQTGCNELDCAHRCYAYVA